MAEYDFIKMQKKLAKYLDEDRYAHTLGVMYTCAALAMVHDCDLIVAQTAGLLHDCAKCIPNKKKLKMCSQHNIPVSEFEQTHLSCFMQTWCLCGKRKIQCYRRKYPLSNYLAYNRKAGDDIAGKNCLYR